MSWPKVALRGVTEVRSAPTPAWGASRSPHAESDSQQLQMPDLPTAKALNAATRLPYTATAIFVGATSGIGQVSDSACVPC